QYRGVIAYVRMIDGRLTTRDRMLMMSTQATHETLEVGVIAPEPVPTGSLGVGEVGYVIPGVKEVRQARVGDTMTSASKPAKEMLGGYRHPKPMVYSGLYPIDGSDYPMLRDALDKLQLNDAALVYEPESSVALGFGFRCGFLGLLHMEIVQERLEREFNLTLLGTAPTVEYRVKLRNGEEIPVDNPDHLPNPADIEAISEPMVLATIVVPSTYVGNMMELSQERRGQFLNMEYEPGDRVVITYRMPLAEI